MKKLKQNFEVATLNIGFLRCTMSKEIQGNNTTHILREGELGIMHEMLFVRLKHFYEREHLFLFIVFLRLKWNNYQ